MYMGEMHHVSATTTGEGEKNEAQILKVWWSPDCHFVLYQLVRFDTDNNPIFSAVNPDPMFGRTLVEYVEMNWPGWTIMDSSTDYTG